MPSSILPRTSPHKHLYSLFVFYSYPAKHCIKSSPSEWRGSPCPCSFVLSRTWYLRLWSRILFFFDVFDIYDIPSMFGKYSYAFLFSVWAEHVLIYLILSFVGIPQPFYLHTDLPSTQPLGELWCTYNFTVMLPGHNSVLQKWNPGSRALLNSHFIGHDGYMCQAGPKNFLRNLYFDFRELIPSPV